MLKNNTALILQSVLFKHLCMLWVCAALKPSFKKRPLEEETYAAEGGSVIVICSPEAAPRPKFVWKKDSVVIGKLKLL